MTTLQLDPALANQMVEKAVTFCAERRFNGDTQAATMALRQGRCDVCAYVSNSLVKQVGEYLGQMDRTVKAVFEFEPEHSSLRPHAGVTTASGRKKGINVVAWVDRKSAALTALGSTLETAISEARRRFGCANATPACYTLGIQMVDDRDVQDRRGFGVIVNSMYVRSVQVWSRGESLEPQGAGDKVGARDALVPFDPEFAPEEMLFEQARAIEALPFDEREALDHRIRELKVSLLRKIISDQLAYIQIAKDWFTIADLEDIHRRKIGYGKIGGKSAGMLLAARILNEVADDSIRDWIKTPDSYFLGSDLMYIFMAMNGLMHRNNQKYKPEEEIRAEYPQIVEEFQGGQFPPEVIEKLQALLVKLGRQPVIVRSSSQLEDNFGTSFAGKYDSHFCPNQGTPAENLAALTRAIARTYASTFKPDALLYRRRKGLQDYDERMAVLIQVVQGEIWGRYYLPHGAGVAFSRNLYRWSPQIRKEDGFVRLVWGLGTRAVERVGNDYPRLVALSHPTLQPDDDVDAIQRYSQQFVDVIDLEDNTFKTLPIGQVLTSRYPAIRYIAQLEQDGVLTTPRTRVGEADIPRLCLTFDEFLRRTPFAGRFSKILKLLEENYHSAVDMEFTVQIPDPFALKPEALITLLQCRPQSHLQTTKVVRLPKELPHEEIIFSTRFMVPQGYLPGIRYVIFITPEGYYSIPSASGRNQLGRIVSKLNAKLPPKSFICVGPGRWGTTNTDLGVYVLYADVCNSGALVELSGQGVGIAPEPSFGTHFFQDLMEAQIYPIAVSFDEADAFFNRKFFYETPNRLSQWLSPDEIQLDECARECLRLIEVVDFRPEHHIDLVMDDEKGQAVAFLSTS